MKSEVFTKVEKLVRAPANFKNDNKWAKDYWKKSIDGEDQDTLMQISVAAENCAKRLGADGVYPEGICGFLKGGYANFLQPDKTEEETQFVEVPAMDPVALVAAFTVDTTVAPNVLSPQLDEIDAAFETMWPRWPQNPDRPGRRSKAASSWRAAARRRGLANIVAAAERYVAWFGDPANGIIHPRHLSNFVSDDDEIDTQLEAIALAPSPRVVAEFQAAWAAYPDFIGRDSKERDSLQFYVRHVPRDDRFAFLMATQVYADERGGETRGNSDKVRYTKAFVSFVAEWKSVDITRPLQRALFTPIWDALVGAGNRLGDIASDMIERFIGGCNETLKLPIPEIPAEVVRRLPEYMTRGVNASAIGAQIIERAYDEAMQRVRASAR